MCFCHCRFGTDEGFNYNKKNRLYFSYFFLVGVLIGSVSLLEEKHKKFSMPLLTGNMDKCR